MDYEALQDMVNELPDEVVEYIGELQQEKDTIQKSLDEANEALAATTIEHDDEVDERDPLQKALDEMPEDAREILDSALDRLESLEAEAVAKARAEADATFIAKAREFDGLGDPDDLGPALRRISEGESTAEDAELIEKALAAAAAQANESGTIYDEIGHAIAKSGSVEAEVDSIAKAYREADPSLTEGDAMAMAWERNPELYDEYVKEQRDKTRL
jgi:hypothetical protein